VTITVKAWGAVTNRGLVRPVNEDALLAEPPLFLVADGMGGHAAGDVASWTAVDSFVELISEGKITIEDTIGAVSTANTAILQVAAASPDKAGMGTTLSGLVSVLAGGSTHWLVLNVGDSRVYRLVGGLLEQLTVDHSEAEEMVTAGRLTREQARGYGRRNVVTRSLGTDPPPVADTWIFPPVAEERFLVCSDGLTNELTDSQIEDCLNGEPDPQRATERLLQMALSAGARDNVTVIVVDACDTDDGTGLGDTTPRVANGH
jgi:protein phosphatase